MNKIVIAIIVVLIGAGAYFYFGPKKTEPNGNQGQETANSKQQTETQTQPTPTPSAEEPAADRVQAVIETSLGNFTVELYAKEAPKTVANFIKLAKEGFYNSLKFHRVIKGFVIQGGDPEGTGGGGPGYTVSAEISLTHKKGAIAMARTDDSVNPTRASSGSQFYVALDDLPSLDGKYTVFGYVTSGMDVVLKIGDVPTEPGDYPINDIVIKRITIE